MLKGNRQKAHIQLKEIVLESYKAGFRAFHTISWEKPEVLVYLNKFEAESERIVASLLDTDFISTEADCVEGKLPYSRWKMLVNKELDNYFNGVAEIGGKQVVLRSKGALQAKGAKDFFQRKLANLKTAWFKKKIVKPKTTRKRKTKQK